MESLRIDHPTAYLRYLDFPCDQTTIVFLHGMGCASTVDYARVIASPALAGHRFLLPDMLGHGYSDAPSDFDYTIEHHAETMAALLDRLGIKGAVLFGHSMGGSVAITLAERRPDLVSRLILSESNLRPGGGTFSKGIAAQAETDFLASGHDAVVERLVAAGMISRAATFRATDALGLHRSAVSLVAGTEPSWSEMLFAMKLPRAWLVGAKSEPEEDIKVMTPQGIPVFVVPKGGHDMAFENPGGVAEAVAQALA